MVALQAVVTLEHLSGLTRDRCVNTWAFTTPSVGYTTSDGLVVANAIRDFYNGTPSGHNPVSALISPCMTRVENVSQIALYDLTGHLGGTPHGSPIDSFFLNLGATTDPHGLPAEAAICLSFHTAYGDDPEFSGVTRPRARDRGRLYIGPLMRGVADEEATTNRVRPSQTARESISMGAARVMAGTGYAWCVWSRKNSVIDPVVAAWVDDAFDTVRRRGERPTTKTNA